VAQLPGRKRWLRKRTWQVRAIFSANWRSVGLSPQHPQHHLRDPLPASHRKAASGGSSINSEKLFRRASTPLKEFHQLSQQQSSIKPAAIVTQKC